jgi:hypothetical protein
MSELALPSLPRVLPDSLARTKRESATFVELVHARYEWKTSPTERARERYEAARATFEADNGKIVDEHWSERSPVGVVTCRQRGRWGHEQWWLHRQTGSMATDHPEFARLLRDAARQSVRASNVLSGMSQRIAISNLFSLTRDIIGSLDVVGAKPTGLGVYQGDLAGIAAYTGQAGARQAQIVYLRGVLRGLGALLVLVPVLTVLISALDSSEIDPMLFVGSLIAGSLGATMSVLIRMSGGKFDVNHEIGREYVSNLGLARPYIGAVFALLLYFAVQGGLLHQVTVPKPGDGEFAFYVAGAFAIGFSERFAKEIVRTAEAGAGSGDAVHTGSK